MRYHSLRENFFHSANRQIELSFMSDGERFFAKHVAARGINLLLVPFSLITDVADTAIGAVAGLVSIVTLGTHKPTYKCAKIHLRSSRTIIADPYLQVLRTINPSAQIGMQINGIVAGNVKKIFTAQANACGKSDNCFVRHVFSRLIYAFLPVASVIARVVDLAIGIIAALLSIVCLGMNENFNRYAYSGLQVTGIIDDLFDATIKMINPWAGQ